MSDESTTVVLVEAAIELAIIERAPLKLTLRASKPGGERERIAGRPVRIDDPSTVRATVVFATDAGELRIPIARVIGARRG